MNRPVTWTLEDLLCADLGKTTVWATNSVRSLVEATLPYPVSPPLSPLPPELDTLLVVGGGTLIDEAKSRAHELGSSLRLVVIPSLWGSGAEASPVVAINRESRKEIRINPGFLPYARVVWPGLANSIPLERARDGCGDAWAHALEGFLSPLADDAVRTDLARLMRCMLGLPLSNDPRWFEMSSQACAGQARSSVGLVHGIAHTLEGPLQAEQPDFAWGHAKLCRTFLWPVIELNRSTSETWSTLLKEYDLDEIAVIDLVRELHQVSAYRHALPVLRRLWRTVLRDPCSRTNSTLIRLNHLLHFDSLPIP